MSWQERTRLLLGEEKLRRIQSAHILVVGLGGVGAYVVEMLARAGVGEMTIDYSARTVTIGGSRSQLSPKEYELLAYLAKNRGIALTREQLLSNVWGYDYFGDDRTLDTHIKLLRKNLGNYAKYIVTLRGIGYRFEKDN